MCRNTIRTLVMATATVVGISCARAYPPTGGERDTLPPRLLETVPAALAIVPGYAGAAVFRFDERISERNFSEALVVVSPLDGAVRVDRAGSEVRVRIDGGWRPDRIYRVVLLPGPQDLFGNARTEQAEIVFSTGPPMPETAIAGIVMDRITGRPAQNGAVSATRQEDRLEYRAVADSVGFFSFRHVPPGMYEMIAFADLNRNRRRDPAEPVDSGRVANLAAPDDTVTVVFNVLPVDTTPPQLTRAEAVDSLHVRVTFDDYFDIDASFDAAAAVVHALPDSTRYAGASRILLAPVFENERAAADAARAAAAMAVDTAAVAEVDTAAVQPARPRTPPPVGPPARTARQATERPLLPSREIVIQLDRPLQPGQHYTVTVAGVVNISGLTGGGIAGFQVQARAPAREPAAEPDVEPDVEPVLPDTIRPDPVPPPDSARSAGR